MTGLDTFNDSILEIATVVTDADLEIVAEGPNLAIYHDDERLDKMDDWNKRTHSRSGLLDRVRNSNLSIMDAENQTLEFLQKLTNKKEAPLCGNSICQDRRFLARLIYLISKITFSIATWMSYRSKLQLSSGHLTYQDRMLKTQTTWPETTFMIQYTS